MRSPSVALFTFLLSEASAFVPTPQVSCRAQSFRYDTGLEMEVEKKSKTNRAFKSLRRVVGAMGTIALALATAGAPGAAMSRTAEAVQTAKNSKSIVVSSFVVGVLAGLVSSKSLSVPPTTPAVLEKISACFPGALPNKLLVSRVAGSLEKYDYGSTSTVATSFDPDEICRPLEADFSNIYGDTFNIGGLAGFPFGGVSSFSAMASSIPENGSCLIVFGPHVGVDSKGNVGTVERRGRIDGGACCKSAAVASKYVADVFNGEILEDGIPQNPEDVLDAQQGFVNNYLLPYAARLEKAADRSVELPYALYDGQKELVAEIIRNGAGSVSGEGKIAVLGGIAINTPPGESDYFLPLSFEIFDNEGTKLEDISL